MKSRASLWNLSLKWNKSSKIKTTRIKLSRLNITKWSKRILLWKMRSWSWEKRWIWISPKRKMWSRSWKMKSKLSKGRMMTKPMSNNFQTFVTYSLTRRMAEIRQSNVCIFPSCQTRLAKTPQRLGLTRMTRMSNNMRPRVNGDVAGRPNAKNKKLTQAMLKNLRLACIIPSWINLKYLWIGSTSNLRALRPGLDGKL